MQKKISREIIICVFLTLSILAVYWNIQHAEFISFDDQDYVVENKHVTSGLTWQGTKWAFLRVDQKTANWHPLTWLSLMLDHEMYGLNAGGFHVTSLFFHIANTLLLFFCLRRMTGALWQSAFVAALFALHPLHVESVAWISERKDVLSTFFWLLTMALYVRYTETPTASRYAAVYLVFLLGLLSKPMLVTLPFVLLLLDLWPLQRLTTGLQDKRVAFLLFEKVPFLILAGIISSITFFAQQRGGAVAAIEKLPFDARIANAAISYVRYIGNTIWPQKLTAFYPYPIAWPLWQVIAAFALILIVTYICIRTIKYYPYLAVGWLWFLGTMVPVIGIVQVGAQSMADRYTYIPLIGLFIIAAWGLHNIFKSYYYGRKLCTTVAVLILAVIMILTARQVQTWENNKALYEHMAAVTENNSLAFNGLGIVYLERKELDRAADFLRKAIEIEPDVATAHHILGIVYLQGKRYEDAIKQFNRSLHFAYSPENKASSHNYRGVAYICLLRTDDAIREFKAALLMDPELSKARVNLIKAYEMQKMMKEKP